MDTAVRPCRYAHNPSRLKPWTPGSKRPATDSPRRGTISPKRSGSAAGVATACLIQLTPAEAAAISAATGQPAAQPFETEAR